MCNSDLATLGTLVYTSPTNADILIYQVGNVLIYHLTNASIEVEGHMPHWFSIKNNVYTIGKGYVNNQDTPIMIALSKIGTIYAMDMSGTAIKAEYVSGTIVAVKN